MVGAREPNALTCTPAAPGGVRKEHSMSRGATMTTDLRATVAGLPAGTPSIASGRVTAAIRALYSPDKRATQANWLGAVAALVAAQRHNDLASQLVNHLGAVPLETNLLDGMSIGEIGVIYEALVALSDHRTRRSQGQYFTPDDVAAFMASHASRFPEGVWLDPCCGVGNLSFHLAAAMPDSGAFVARRLSLIDLDPIALKTAQALLIANFANDGDFDALPALVRRSHVRDFLDTAELPSHEFAIVNPPYARTTRDERFVSAEAGELYAYFLERVASESNGFIAITPASHLGGVKYASLRGLLGRLPGGDVFVFDNVPDTCFRGYKYGSTNTSKTNFVRAAITVVAPSDSAWRITPILRWAAKSRRRMWEGAPSLLLPRRKGPGGEWAKVMPGTETVWDALAGSEHRLRDLVSKVETPYRLHIASTPRYYITATKRDLDRGSKHVLYFATQNAMDEAYVLLNSSLPYWWWRCIDGGDHVTLANATCHPDPAAASRRRRACAAARGVGVCGRCDQAQCWSCERKRPATVVLSERARRVPAPGHQLRFSIDLCARHVREQPSPGVR